ncbi:hypothetical protein [Candidatus Liberibacter brunswickensis]|uniref:hypothetical protein n=1 Tax=Candidatus Liberibacter brunswickensis TaxID=1968796 RepID=UPI002FE3907A
MVFENQFLEDILKQDKKEKKIKSLAHILQGIAIHAILSNRTKNIKSITKGLIEYWIAYNSRAWRMSQPKSSLNIHITSADTKYPISIHIGSAQKSAKSQG